MSVGFGIPADPNSGGRSAAPRLPSNDAEAHRPPRRAADFERRRSTPTRWRLRLAATHIDKGAAVALNAYLKLVGQKTGEIRGSVTQKGREGKVMVIAATHDIVTPRDPASGLPTGKRMHKPFVITKEMDKSSPLLLNALNQNENLTSVLIGLLRNGTQVATIKLTNANIASYATHGLTETWSFTYQKITWTWVDG